MLSKAPAQSQQMGQGLGRSASTAARKTKAPEYSFQPYWEDASINLGDLVRFCSNGGVSLGRQHRKASMRALSRVWDSQSRDKVDRT